MTASRRADLKPKERCASLTEFCGSDGRHMMGELPCHYALLCHLLQICLRTPPFFLCHLRIPFICLLGCTSCCWHPPSWLHACLCEMFIFYVHACLCRFVRIHACMLGCFVFGRSVVNAMVAIAIEARTISSVRLLTRTSPTGNQPPPPTPTLPPPHVVSPFLHPSIHYLSA
ncbi:unnamed protein product [Protopolystoma xenopodis]|uniref:Uncharacterized protein n=1 Tax=Protopolystoma xenopodis TaxID=117903 RepID=A0A3S5CJF6_9PLAT|nr:unnamed protein product [Protopolystoma xenopodis]